MSQKQFELVKDKNQDLSVSFNDIFEAFALSEIALSISHPLPWEDSDMAKRRKTYEFDENLQEILLYRGIHFFAATKIECGSKNFYRCELCNSKGGIIHLGNSFQKAEYRKKYIKMNSKKQTPTYIFIQYSLNSEKNRVEKICIRIPYLNKKDLIQDITDNYVVVRNRIHSFLATRRQLVEAIKPFPTDDSSN